MKKISTRWTQQGVLLKSINRRPLSVDHLLRARRFGPILTVFVLALAVLGVLFVFR